MSRDLHRKHLDAITARDLRAMLSIGPWCWPHETDVEAWTKALELVPAGPPALAPGSVPLVTVTGDGAAASLFGFCLGSPPQAGVGAGTSLAASIEAVWESAAIALPRSLPLLWTSVQTAHDAHRAAYHLITQPFTAAAAMPPREIEGPSFGLAFVLALASHILGQPPPGDLIASATVAADGSIGSVEGLREKIRVVEDAAPRIGRLLVAAVQADEAMQLAERLDVVPVRSAAHAIEIVFGEAFRTFLRDQGTDLAARSELVESFFRLAMLGRSAVVDWTPVEQGAALALSEWQDLDRDAHWRLTVAKAVAARHERNDGVLPIPDGEQLSKLPATLRVASVIQVVQQCADTGRPDPVEVEALLSRTRYLVPLTESFAPHLKLWGARARLLAVTGRPEEALRTQEDLAGLFFAQYEYDQLSYQLAEWYRLSGAVDDRAAYDRAEEMLARVNRLGGLGFHGNCYVDLARARAAVCLGRTGPGSPEEVTLRRLGADLQVPEHVRWSAVRWLLQLLDGPEHAEERQNVLASLREASVRPGRAGDTARLHRKLAELDVAIRKGPAAMLEPLVQSLRDLDGGLIGHLIRAADTRRVPRASYIARHYPY